MTPERWKRIESLVEAALEHEAPERSGFLDSACGRDRELRRAVETLLESFQVADSFMETPPARGFSAPGRRDPRRPAASERLERVGPYRILRQLGRGGMGTVYSAAREDHEFEQRVAIKLVRPGMASKSLARRFRSERQILADLDHPNIAKLLDGGTAEDGRPYFVMELIDGARIDKYCDVHRLTLRQRLEIFREVCAAVHYAHRNLVVHRDIKPSNILVTAEGVPKLLDFGIAKLLDPADFPQPVEATTGLRPMTPPYASPEQIRGGAITTASDVYSLGALLYELLTGRLPVEVRGLRSPELEKVLIEELPTRPSAAVSRRGGGPTAEEVGRRRGAGVQQLRRQLAGDLDNIVLMALRKEPERRYGSVEQLSEDLRRHLEGLPVSARRDTFGYRAGKFLRRNKLAAGIAGSSLALVLGFAATMTAQAIQLARQRDRARRERDKAKSVSTFLADLFKLADPEEARGSDVTARELLDGSAERVRCELATQPDVQASLLATIGGIYRKLGLYDQAEPLLNEALVTRTELFGGRHLEVADSSYELAHLYFEKGRYDDAARLFQDALDVREEALGPGHPTVAETTIHLADTYLRNGNRRRAERLYRRGLHLLQTQSGLQNPLAAEALAGLGGIHRRRGDYDRARVFQQRALEIFEKVLPPDHPTIAKNLIQLASNDTLSGATDRAEPLYERALTSLEQTLGKTHQARAVALNEYANHQVALGQFGRAEPLYRQSFEILEKTTGESHPDAVASLVNLGICHSVTGRYDLAEAFYRRALEAGKNAVGQNRSLQASALFKLAIIYRRKGRYAHAEPLFLQAVGLFEELGLETPDLASCLSNLARLYFETGQLDRAEPLYRRALEIRRRTYGDDHLYVAQTLTDLGDLATRAGEHEGARSFYERALGKLERFSARDPRNMQNLAALAAVHRGLGDLFCVLKDRGRARREWKETLALFESAGSTPEVVEDRDVHCRALLRLGRAEEARPIAEYLLSIGWRAPDFLAACREQGLMLAEEPAFEGRI